MTDYPPITDKELEAIRIDVDSITEPFGPVSFGMANDVRRLLAEVDRLRAALNDKPIGPGEEEWAIRVVTKPGGKYHYHDYCDPENAERDLAATLQVVENGHDGFGNPVPHGPVSIVKRTVWSTEWETVKSVPEDRFGTTATQHDPSRAFHQGTEDEVQTP